MREATSSKTRGANEAVGGLGGWRRRQWRRRPRRRRGGERRLLEGERGQFSYQEGTGSVRFVSVPDFSNIDRFGSVRKLIYTGSTRFVLHLSDASWLGPLRFGSASGSAGSGSN